MSRPAVDKAKANARQRAEVWSPGLARLDPAGLVLLARTLLTPRYMPGTATLPTVALLPHASPTSSVHFRSPGLKLGYYVPSSRGPNYMKRPRPGSENLAALWGTSSGQRGRWLCSGQTRQRGALAASRAGLSRSSRTPRRCALRSIPASDHSLTVTVPQDAARSGTFLPLLIAVYSYFLLRGNTSA